MARDLSGEMCAPFVYGAKDTVAGEVCESVVGDFLTVTYPDLTAAGGSYKDLYVIVQANSIEETQLPVGKWPYTLDKKFCDLSGKCTIPVLDAWRSCGLKLYIGVHAGFSPDGVADETGWMKGGCITDKPNCPKQFIFTTECKCPVVTKYEPVVASVVYKKTIVETHTDYCTSFPADVATKTSCDTPYVATTKIVSVTAEAAGFTCPIPV